MMNISERIRGKIQSILVILFIGIMMFLLLGIYNDLQFIIFSLLLLVIPIILKPFIWKKMLLSGVASKFF